VKDRDVIKLNMSRIMEKFFKWDYFNNDYYLQCVAVAGTKSRQKKAAGRLS
jgi:hypothetical protein